MGVGMTENEQVRLPAELPAEQVVVIVDSREQTPWDLSPLKVVPGTLCTGDVALASAPNIARIERKSLDDLLGCVGRDRDRFDREMQRMLSFPIRVLVIEADWTELEQGNWRSKLTPEHVIGSLMGWAAQGISIHAAGDHTRAGRHAARLLYTIARRRYRELRTMLQASPPTTATDASPCT